MNKSTMILLLLMMPLLGFADSGSHVLRQGFDHDHALWSQTLNGYQSSDGLIRYKKLKADIDRGQAGSFTSYLDHLSAVGALEYQKWTKGQKKAFLINAYNAFTVKLIVDHYPIESITDIGGWLWRINKKPWRMEFFSLLDNKIRSLDPIEHEYLRSDSFKDYRIHAALNCASISCPPLRAEAFIASKLDIQLTEQMQIWIRDPARNNLETSPAQISKIFDWFADDFKKWGGGTAAVLRRYAQNPNLKNLKDGGSFDHLDYDWGLNES